MYFNWIGPLADKVVSRIWETTEILLYLLPNPLLEGMRLEGERALPSWLGMEKVRHFSTLLAKHFQHNLVWLLTSQPSPGPDNSALRQPGAKFINQTWRNYAKLKVNKFFVKICQYVIWNKLIDFNNVTIAYTHVWIAVKVGEAPLCCLVLNCTILHNWIFQSPGLVLDYPIKNRACPAAAASRSCWILDLKVSLGPLGTSWTFRYLLDLQVPLGPLSTSWTFRCLLDFKVPLVPLGISRTFRYLLDL